jgi:hypothetical protein
MAKNAVERPEIPPPIITTWKGAEDMSFKIYRMMTIKWKRKRMVAEMNACEERIGFIK